MPKTTVMSRADILNARHARGADADPLEQTCWNLYVVLYDADTGICRKHVLHTHDVDDRDLAFDYWRLQVQRSPEEVRAVEMVATVQTLVKAAIKEADTDYYVYDCEYSAKHNG